MGETQMSRGGSGPDGLGERPPVVHVPRRAPLVGDYEQRRRSFTWEEARGWLEGLPGGGINIAHEAVDRHAHSELADTVALRFLSRTEPTSELTYADLARLSDVAAVALRELGVERGDRVCTLLPRSPELYLTALGTLKAGAVYCPLFPAFGTEPVRQRLELGSVRVLVTDTLSYTRKVAAVRDRLPGLRVVLLVDAPEQGSDEGGTVPWATVMADAARVVERDGFTIAATAPEDPALLHFTSGTTGRPKGAVHVHEAVVAHHATSRFCLDLAPGDTYWCTADPGWVTGTSYGIIGPLTCGVTVVTDSADFDARRWWSILQDQRISVFYTAPTALRMLMRKGAALAREHDLSALRHVVSVGEPLNPEAVVWGTEAFGMPVHDTWWQTETGAIMVSNYPGMPVRPGSMGRPVPGVEVGILARGEDGRAAVVDGHVHEVSEAGGLGELALRPGWPSMFRGYLGEPERYARAFADGWYLTGDLARRDGDGYLWFVGRADDVIKSAGHLIGPFEVESALMEHPAVAEVGVIGKPDPLAGEIVKAFVTLKAEHEPTEALRRELIVFGRRRLGSVAPREVEFDEHLPHTRSGKVMRRLLKARELGLPEGDLSTVEHPS
ncbi:acetate--CoA ligase [Ornithinimicrobium sediminis]|uniref:acetate--CoA ligase n=1 Tax=Ornithinimicrobium sediminis TaxID=2904603 RepID=UPI001E3ADD26|nr:acetate--CoA ligase [Ornithinimicrobium sediminis]MCE0488090.1 acetate--CoA ligase [Ornithinimicrobium sediminis]